MVTNHLSSREQGPPATCAAVTDLVELVEASAELVELVEASAELLHLVELVEASAELVELVEASAITSSHESPIVTNRHRTFAVIRGE